jgi:HEAT repeat protein
LLATAIRDEAFAVRMAAWQAVRGATLPASTEVLALLQEALRHKEPGARVTAARMLAKMGAAAGPAVPGPVKALRDPDEGVRKEVAEALQQIDAEAAKRAGVR